MANISAKVNLISKYTEKSRWLEAGIASKGCSYFDLVSGSFVPVDFGVNLYMSLEDSLYEKSFYIFPQTLVGMEIYITDYHQYKISQKINLDPVLELAVGDAVTFNIDIQKLLQGSGGASFEWETISWNDLGEVSIP